MERAGCPALLTNLRLDVFIDSFYLSLRGTSPGLPHWYSVKLVNPLVDCKMYQKPVEGRQTAMSVLPSPS